MSYADIRLRKVRNLMISRQWSLLPNSMGHQHLLWSLLNLTRSLLLFGNFFNVEFFNNEKNQIFFVNRLLPLNYIYFYLIVKFITITGRIRFDNILKIHSGYHLIQL